MSGVLCSSFIKVGYLVRADECFPELDERPLCSDKAIGLSRHNISESRNNKPGKTILTYRSS